MWNVCDNSSSMWTFVSEMKSCQDLNVSHECEFPIYYVDLEAYFRTSNLACETLCENALPEANMWKACEMYAITVQACESLFQKWNHVKT